MEVFPFVASLSFLDWLGYLSLVMVGSLAVGWLGKEYLGVSEGGSLV